MLVFVAPETILPTMLQGAQKGLSLAVTLLAIYSIWLTVLKIYEKTNTTRYLAKAMNPITKRIFPNESLAAYSHINLNLSANILGMGGVATPMGIKAMENLTQKRNKIMLIIVNSTSLQLIPTTVVAIRAGLGATTDIILSSLIVSIATTTVGMILVRILVK